jgi:hypothetical protein
MVEPLPKIPFCHSGEGRNPGFSGTPGPGFLRGDGFTEFCKRLGDKSIFMTFADFHEDGTICADGKLYTEGKIEELDDEGEVVCEEFFVDMVQSIGYLVHREADLLVFQSALSIMVVLQLLLRV